MSERGGPLFYSIRYREALEEIREILNAALMGDMVSMGRLNHIADTALDTSGRERGACVPTARDSAPLAHGPADGRDVVETGLLAALREIAGHADQYGPDGNTEWCDQSCADDMIGIARQALRRYEGDVQIGMG